jgi:hypothetical protein
MRFLILFVLLAGVACSSGPMTVAELEAYVKDQENGLTQAVESNGYSIRVTFRPTDLWVKQEIGEERFPDAQELAKLRSKYNAYYYFIVSLSRNDKEALHQLEGGMEQYSDLVQTLSFRMPQYTTLTTSASDTIPVGDFMLNRTYGLSRSTDLLFVFSREKAGDDAWVQFNLNEFGLGTGNQRFRFDREKLDKAPELVW